MKLDALLTDATQSHPSASRRSREIALVDLLNDKYPHDPITHSGVAKWLECGSLPAKWLIRVISLRNPPLNVADYV